VDDPISLNGSTAAGGERGCHWACPRGSTVPFPVMQWPAIKGVSSGE
jgi:hypothetical protein